MSFLTKPRTTFRMMRLFLKYSNLFLVACLIFLSTLTFTTYKRNSHLRSENAALITRYAELKEQVNIDKKEWQALYSRTVKEAEYHKQRQQRLNAVMRRPEVRQTADARVAPVISHALQELREKQ